MTRPRLLDLFCGAGGCSVGYERAGFDVVGVDIAAHPDYPFPFMQADAMSDFLYDSEWIAHNDFDVIHASPPCQSYTTMSNRARGDWPDLLAPVLAALRGWVERGDGFWVVENVPGARSQMPDTSITLHGGMFGLGVDRPRLFASNVMLLAPIAPRIADPVGVYGKAADGRRLYTRKDGTSQFAASSLAEGSDAMGIDWMTDWRDVAESIPPAYTEFIGEQLLTHLSSTTVPDSADLSGTTVHEATP